ncbi:MAG: response regulator [Gemmatimonadales bacterium]|nr:MAG: response regulator [Gemmatimonadales bacterium]
MSVLLVDDEPDILDTLEDFLGDAGYSTCRALNGAVAMDCMARELPCLVILDLRMPVLDGHEVILRMRGSKRLANVPVLISTSDPSRAPRGIPLLKKPMDLSRLLDAVRTHCPRPGPGGSGAASA